MIPPLYAEGNPNARLILIGEAPGAAEAQTGLPFQGPAGDLLNQCLHSAGIFRQECYITNVLKFKPEDNDASPFTSAKEGTVEHAIYHENLGSLSRELASCSGDVIVCLGETALKAITGLSSITKRRGSVYTIEVGGRSRHIIGCLHPAAALRTYVWRNLITWDLIRAREILDKGWNPPERTIHLRPSCRDAISYINECFSIERPVGFDIEVVNEELYCFGLGLSPTDVMVIGLRDLEGDRYNPHEETDILQALGRLAASKTFLGQNLNFDYTFMLSRYGIYLKDIEDTMIAQAILYPDFNKGLDFITSIYTTEPYYKDEGKMHNKIENVEKFWLYNGKDVAVCLEAWPKQIEELQQMGNYDTYRRKCNIIQQLAYMQHRGTRMDTEGMRQAALDSTTRIAELERELDLAVKPHVQAYLPRLPDPTTSKQAKKLYNCVHRMAEYFNSNSPDQVATYFYKIRGLPAYRGKGGGETTDEDALKRVARKGYPEATTILDIRGESKARGTYYTMRLDEDGRLRCSMNPVGAETGRFSSSQTIFGTGGNMQNQTRKMLGFQLADPYHFFFSLDLEQAENRIVAVLANDEKMLAAFAAGIDIHSLTASYILHKPPSEISNEPNTAPIGPKHWSERDLGKRTNHGLNYNMGVDRFALKNEMQNSDSKILIDLYHSVYPKVRGNFHYEVKQELYDKRILTNCLGRSRLFLDRLSDSMFNEGYAFIPQSTVADLIDEGLVWIENNSGHRGCMERLEFMNNVHDSLVIQASLVDDREYIADCMTQLIRQLEQEIYWKDRSFRIPVGVKVGLNLGKTRSIKLKGELGQHYIDPTDLRAALEELTSEQTP